MVEVTWQPRGDVTLHFHISIRNFHFFEVLLLLDIIIIEIVDITVVKHLGLLWLVNMVPRAHLKTWLILSIAQPTKSGKKAQ